MGWEQDGVGWERDGMWVRWNRDGDWGGIEMGKGIQMR